ncbi:DNA photolyase [Candidatus Marinamargulisbacteria bacterium SCGC AG-343-K17]|nr:DNA photolyase [Candidatus Marinamargulisbacteria bacterium SCGC AG-343-K17]
MSQTYYRDGKKSVEFVPYKGEKMDTCATIHDEYVCCNVKVLKSVSNCPFDCSYCFLQNYLTNPQLEVVEDNDRLIQEIESKIKAQPWRFFRIGTWELGDSLALENDTGQAQKLIDYFSTVDNAVLELKTKSDVVDPILTCDHNQKTVVSWSMNTDYIIRTEEHKTASLEKRLIAIKKVVDAGYLIGLHFDPMIRYDEWATDYTELLTQLADIVPAEQIAWLSIGSLRFNPEQKRLIENNFRGSKLTCQEMVKGSDNKVRYVKPHRIEMYRLMFNKMRELWGNDPFIYLCMERWDMWDKIMDIQPRSIGELDYMFADHFHRFFPVVNPQIPNLELYKKYQST